MYIRTLGFKHWYRIRDLYKRIEEMERDGNPHAWIRAPIDRRKYNFVYNKKHSDELMHKLETFVEEQDPQHSHYNISKSPNMRYIVGHSPYAFYILFCARYHITPKHKA